MNVTGFAAQSATGSLWPPSNLGTVGGIPETQQMLNFYGEHGIVSDVEIIPIQEINEAYERMLKSDVKYRFVIDMALLKSYGEHRGR
jgi:hypothetical protein